MIYVDSIKFPSTDSVNTYLARHCITMYPWSVFLANEFESMTLKDITILYGNNGSGKSTVMNLIAEKISAQRNTELFKDVHYYMADIIHPFEDFVANMEIEMSYDDDGRVRMIPLSKKLITSDDIFQKIANRVRYNQRSIVEIEQTRQCQQQITKKGYTYKSLDDYDELVAWLDAVNSTKKNYAERHAPHKQQMQSNGETALSVFAANFEESGIYLLDEPENCLSPVYQIELIKLLQESVRYFDCQFVISTHSPLLLSLKNALIYNLDTVPVRTDSWADLENVKIYFDFFSKHKDDFGK